MSIEEPFSILPLERICAGIQRDVRELLATHGSTAGTAGSSAAGDARVGPPPAEALVAAAWRDGVGGVHDA